MNYLAHFQLCGSNDGMIIGALLGDFIKGPLPQNADSDRLGLNSLPPFTREGIQLHRRIDGHFDQLHAQLFSPQRDSQAPLSFKANRYRRYLPIVLDLVFDHFLSRYWQSYSTLSLRNL